MSNIDVNITLQQSKKVIRFNQIDGIGIIKEDGSMDFFDRVKESRISEMSREEISGLKEEIRVVVEEMAANDASLRYMLFLFLHQECSARRADGSLHAGADSRLAPSSVATTMALLSRHGAACSA